MHYFGEIDKINCDSYHFHSYKTNGSHVKSYMGRGLGVGVTLGIVGIQHRGGQTSKKSASCPQNDFQITL